MLLYLSDLLYRILPFIPTAESTLPRLAIGQDIYYVRIIGQLVSLASKFLRFAGLLFRSAARSERTIRRDALPCAAGALFMRPGRIHIYN